MAGRISIYAVTNTTRHAKTEDTRLTSLSLAACLMKFRIIPKIVFFIVRSG